MQCRKQTHKEEPRVLKFEKQVYYRKGVLIGPWPEENCSYKKEFHKHDTTFRRDYIPKSSPSNVRAVWQNRFRHAGYEAPLLFDYEGDRYLNNFSTTYELTYNYFPKLYNCKPHHPLDKEKLPECINNYGNRIDYGLQKDKKCEWLEDKTDPRKTSTTMYENQFVEYQESDADKIKRTEDQYIESCDPITWKCKVVCKPKPIGF